MSDIVSYKYSLPSVFSKKQHASNLVLANYSEIQKKTVPCFFWGNIENAFEVARCLITISNTVQSSFNLSPFQMALLKDPIVTAGNNKIRFEGFSHCAGVYVRADILEKGHHGEFLENGTTNVDFNQAMISALGTIARNDTMMLSVGENDVRISTQKHNVIERKVPLPKKWIKGLTTVQHYMSESEIIATLNKIQALQLFKTIPKGKVKNDYYLIKRGAKFMFSPMPNNQGVVIGGIHRLHLLTNLLPLVDVLKIFSHNHLQSVTFQLYIKDIVFTFSLSRDTWRGFSGEGVLLEELMEDLPNDLIQRMDNYSFANQEFNKTLTAIEENISFSKIDNLTAKLSALGLLGFDLDQNHFFYRRLPFELKRIVNLNPRLKGVEKLLEQNKVEIIKNKDNYIEARVEGSGVKHLVILDKTERCTCVWFSQNQGERGPCKHILAVKKKTS
ncbi:MAG: SWIM zinc finger family protein [Aestuariibaculum sp.]